MNAEEIIQQLLEDAGFGAYFDVPANRPDEFLVIEETSGNLNNYVRITQTVDIDCWSQTRKAAKELAQNAIQELRTVIEHPYVFNYSITSFYRNPDPESKTPRYTIGVEIVLNE